MTMCLACSQRVLRDDVFGVFSACYVKMCLACSQRVSRKDVFGVFSACVT